MKKVKINILRLVAFSCLMCVASVAVFSMSDILFERLTRAVGESSDKTKNALWLISQLENLTLMPILAALGALLYRGGKSYKQDAANHREKKIQLVILLMFLYFVFLPYYISQNMAGNVNAFQALGDKTIWFATQLIMILVLIMYHSDRESKLLIQAKENSEEGKDEN